MRTRTLPTWITLLAMLGACDEGAGSRGAGGAEPGDAGSEVEVTQSGEIVAYKTTMGIAGVNVALGNRQGTTDPSGHYAIVVPKDTPYEMILTASGYFKVIAQEWAIHGDVVRGSTNFVSDSQWASFVSGFESIGGVPRDPALGLVAVLVLALPSCPTTGGATVAITPTAPNTRILYVDDSGSPSTNTTTSAMPLSVHALIYNAPVGAVSMSISSPTCPEAPWPVSTNVAPPGSGPFTDTGKARVEAGNAVSYLRVYLGH
jgi:hypothetical protein